MPRPWNKKHYKQIKVDGKVMLYHRHIMEQHIGRKLKHEEFVHHINHDPFDNRIENLEITSHVEHMRHHNTKYSSRTCAITDCKKKRFSKGICSMHYRRLRVHGDTSKNPKVVYDHENQTCSLVDCNREIFCLGFCERHYKKYKKYGDATYKIPKKSCSHRGCNRKYSYNSYCATHATQFINHGFTKEIRNINKKIL